MWPVAPATCIAVRNEVLSLPVPGGQGWTLTSEAASSHRLGLLRQCSIRHIAQTIFSGLIPISGWPLTGERELWLSYNISGVSHRYPLQNPCFHGFNHSFRRLREHSTEEDGIWFEFGKKKKKIQKTNKKTARIYLRLHFPTTQGRAAYAMVYERESKGDWHTNPSCKQNSRKVSREVQAMIKSLARNKRE